MDLNYFYLEKEDFTGSVMTSVETDFFFFFFASQLRGEAVSQY
jgi:hypothetical protein